MTLPHLIHSAITKAVHKFLTREEIILPEKILYYHLEKDLNPHSKSQIGIGLYTDEQGKKVVAKMWKGRFKNLTYFLLKHEIEVSRILSSAQTRLKYKNRTSVWLANYVGSLQSNNSLVLLTSYIEGKPLSDLSARKQIKWYRHSLEFLNLLSKELTKNEKQKIGKRPFSHYLYLFPFTAITVFFTRPLVRFQLLKSIKTFLQGLKSMTKNPGYSLVHGDLNGSNILMDKKGAHIIDLDQITYTYPEYEIIRSMASVSFDQLVQSYLKKLLLTDGTKKSTAKVKALTVNLSLYDLTGDLTPVEQKNYKKILHFGLNI